MAPPRPHLASRYAIRASMLAAALLLAACATSPRLPPAGAAIEPTETPAQPAAPTQAAPPSAPALPAAEPLATNRERLAARIGDMPCPADALRLAGPFQPRHLQRVLEQRNDLFSWVLSEIHARRLPGQFAAMPVLESAYQADPGNRGAVRGMWQFSAATGRRFGLHIDAHRDERLSALASTRAALDHLGEMWRRWGDWRLAVIGFNAGEYTVTVALRRDPDAIAAGRLPRGLPTRAQQYVERTAAVTCLLLNEPSLQPYMDLPPPQLASYTLPVGLRSLDDATGWLGNDRATLLRLNPELQRYPFPLAHEVAVLAVAERGSKETPALASAAEIAAAKAQAPEPVAHTPREHRVASGESPWLIARRYRIPLRDLMRWNGLRDGSVLKPGQRLRLEP